MFEKWPGEGRYKIGSCTCLILSSTMNPSSHQEGKGEGTCGIPELKKIYILHYRVPLSVIRQQFNFLACLASWPLEILPNDFDFEDFSRIAQEFLSHHSHEGLETYWE